MDDPLETPDSVSPAADAAPPVAAPLDSFGRLRRLPVEISVRLAEKKIPMPQLLGITPGMLITFNKSCEDLLDLYVNNTRYCRGEAVKIGENFGLKINQVGVRDEVPRKVIEG
jgi:flagellar motor switch protein FliN/FliY